MWVPLFVGSWLLVDFIGYWLHRLAHQPWSPLYASHMTHHVQLYPAKDFTSDKYRSSGGDSLALWFAPMLALYWILSVVLLGWASVPVLVGSLPPALLSTFVHDWTHTNNSPLRYTKWTRKWIYIHLQHHRNHKKDLGITIFWWDRLFRTYKEPRQKAR